MKKTLVILAAAILSATLLISGKPIEKRQVTFVTSIDCKKCVEKVRENMSFEKGVEDLEVTLDDQTVKITYNTAKTDTTKLGAAIRKLGYTAKVLKDTPTPASKRP